MDLPWVMIKEQAGAFLWTKLMTQAITSPVLEQHKGAQNVTIFSVLILSNTGFNITQTRYNIHQSITRDFVRQNFIESVRI